MRRLAAWAALPLVAGCLAAGEGVPPAAPGCGVTYACEDGRTVTATYVNGADGASVALLNIGDGAPHYALSQAVAASGVRYVGDGPEPGVRLQWWTRGLTEGTLATLAPGEEVADDPGTLCLAAP